MHNRHRLATAALGLGIMWSPLLTALPAHADSAPPALTCTDQGTQTTTCTITGTTEQGTVTISLAADPGVTWPVGAYRMASGAGTMTVTREAVTFAFDVDYLATHDAPYSYSGSIGFRADDYNYKGPFSVIVAGETHTWGSADGYCDATCKARPELGSKKSAWDNGDGTVGANIILGRDDVTVGQTYTLSDQPGPGQSDCIAGGLVYQDEAGQWQEAGVAGGDDLKVTFTAVRKAAYLFTVTCHIDGTQETYTDVATINGHQYTAGTSAAWAGADGSGNTKPTPTPTASPTPSETPTPTPTETPSWTPTPQPSTPSVPSTPQPSVTQTPSAPVAPKPSTTSKRVTFRAQIDTDRIRTAAQAKALNSIGTTYAYREDVRWNTKTGKVYSAPLWARGVESHRIVTLNVTVPATATPAQILQAERVMAAETAGVNTNRLPAAHVGHTTITAWLIPAGAWDDKTAWRKGPRTAPQLLAGSVTR